MDRKIPIYLRGFSFGPCFDFLGRNRIRGSSFIGHHSLKSFSKAIWKALRKEGLQITYRGFHMTVSRARKMRTPTAAGSRGKQDSPPAAQGLQEAKVEAVDERDPFANLKRLEEKRPGFHWRGTRNVKTPVIGREESSDKHK